MAAVLYLLGLISIVLGAIVAADPFVDTYQLGLSVSVAYQAIVGGVLLFVMARLLQHAAATARNTEKFYQQVLQNPGSATAVTAATAVAAQDVKAEPKIEAPAKTEPAAPAPVEPAAPAAEATSAPEAAETPAAEAAPAEPAAVAAATETESAPAAAAETLAAAETASVEPAAAPAAAPAAEAETTIVEQLEYRGYMIDKLSNGKVDVHTAEGPMQFESLETFQRELELSNG
ncbi:MAG: hypothetical protein AAGF81_05905 [Pseudomonadota bacterium]